MTKEKRVGIKIKISRYEIVKNWLKKEMGESWLEERSAAQIIELYIEKVEAKFEVINKKQEKACPPTIQTYFENNKQD